MINGDPYYGDYYISRERFEQLRSCAVSPGDVLISLVGTTGKVLILHEDTLIGGLGGELSAWINENCFDMLDAPVMRCALLDTPVPFNIELEKQFLAKARLKETIQKLLHY